MRLNSSIGVPFDAHATIKHLNSYCNDIMMRISRLFDGDPLFKNEKECIALLMERDVFYNEQQCLSCHREMKGYPRCAYMPRFKVIGSRLAGSGDGGSTCMHDMGASWVLFGVCARGHLS